MMSIRVDWDKLRKVQEDLSELPTITDTTEVMFIMIMADQSSRKSVVKFKDFLTFFWSLSENPHYNVLTLVVQDKEGRVLYRHKPLTPGNEEIPLGGNANVITHWKTLTRAEKDMYLNLMVAQIQGYEQ